MKLHEELVKEGTFAVVFFSPLSFHKSKKVLASEITALCMCVFMCMHA
jgi:hypothetical protein